VGHCESGLEGLCQLQVTLEPPTWNCAIRHRCTRESFAAQLERIISGTEHVCTSGGSMNPCVREDSVSGKHFLSWGNGSPVYAQLNDGMISVNTSAAAGQRLMDCRDDSFVKLP
jgi:hypothetical protein